MSDTKLFTSINSRYAMMVEVGTAQTCGKEENARWG